MDKPKVSIVRIEDYNSEEIYQAIKQSLQLLGGLDKFVKPKSKIFVKINHISPPSPAEKGLVTHPAFTKEVLRLLKERGHEVVVGDDIQSKEEDGFLISDYRQACEELGVLLINLKEKGFKEVEFQGRLLDKVYLSQACLEADYIINLPKLKTHSFTIYTGAVKNMYGIIPYGLRLKYHRQYIRNDDFSQMLVDVLSCAPPQLNIMDGIMAMEGEGPSAGNLRKTGLILASPDAVALDAVATKIMSLNPLDIFTTYYAHNRGLGMGRIEGIEVVGETIPDVQVKNFKHSAIAVGLFRRKLPSFLYAYFQEQLVLIPRIKKEKCTACLECIEICPMEALQLHQDTAVLNRRKCIYCMCCHEVCRYNSIELKKRFIGRIVQVIYNAYHKLSFLFS
ncbi:MAG: DUF362 domain-containing protein [Candidatus Aminicenantes bacterium]|nr:DUF362 domain-containing protein [Candidatus Aminicenantes bacterium]